jgi:four helix bundle protein
MFPTMPTNRDLRERTIVFAVAIIQFCRELPRTAEGRHIGGQLLRAGTGVAANYRAVCRSRSRADFIAKLGTVIEEADESDFWMEVAVRSNVSSGVTVVELRAEANELVAIFTQSQKTARENGKR